MSARQEPHPSEDLIGEREVADYLRAHPEFFQNNPSLLAQIQIPHACGDAVSLVEYQISVLRDQNHQMKRKLRELVQTGRDNDRISERMHRLTQGLLAAESFDATLTRLFSDLEKEFQADAVALRLFRLPPALAEAHPELACARSDPRLAPFDQFLHAGRPLCGRLRAEQLEFLFPERRDDIGSAAVLTLGPQGEWGMLAVGSLDADRFHPGMGTLFLSRLAGVIAAALRRYMGPPDTHG
jgi:hypothetical protein